MDEREEMKERNRDSERKFWKQKQRQKEHLKD